MNFSVPHDARRPQAAPRWRRAADTELLQSHKYATEAAFRYYTYFSHHTTSAVPPPPYLHKLIPGCDLNCVCPSPKSKSKKSQGD